jgi:cobalt/nickel transport system permease protein
MHIPDGFISTPINAATYVVSGGLTAVALRHAGRELGDRQVPFLGVTAAFIFAAQMLNFPVAGGTSGHFLGAMLAAVLLGPLNAFLVMAVVLVIQCLAFADGGLTALGTNIFNMGAIGGLLCYGIFVGMRAVLPKTRTAFLAAVGACSWMSVVIASSACAIELGLSGTVPLAAALPAMSGVHALIGLGEALITVTVVAMVLKTRPDLVAAWRGASITDQQTALGKSWIVVVIAGSLISVALAVFVSPYASSWPDGLEKVAGDIGFIDRAAEHGAWKSSPAPDYAAPGIGNEAMATAAAGFMGTIITLAAGWGLVRLVRRRRQDNSAHAKSGPSP